MRLDDTAHQQVYETYQQRQRRDLAGRAAEVGEEHLAVRVAAG